MTSEPETCILVVDDDRAALEALEALFSDDYRVLTAGSGEAAVEALDDCEDIASVVMDIRMPGMDGIEAARLIRGKRPDLPVIFHTGYPGEYDQDKIDEAEKPFDYIHKAGSVSRLTRAVRNAVDAYSNHKRVRQLCERAEASLGMVGRSAVMREVFRLVWKVAPTDYKVLVIGETGTGKELVARALHAGSGRADKPLAIISCSHKSPDLIESELFGHVRGSFTGAVTDRVGLFEYANGGTVFLDEVGDLDIGTQAKVLRVLETGEYQKVGSPETLFVSVRLVSATNRDLEEMVEAGTFRRDLYFRLRGITIKLPPLRDRREDIPLLAERFLNGCTIESDLPPKILDKSAIAELVKFEWPGNVRQLKDTIESLTVLTDSDLIVGSDVQRYLEADTATAPESGTSQHLRSRLMEYRRNIIIETLHETDGNISAAARILGVDRNNLRKMIIDHGIELP